MTTKRVDVSGPGFSDDDSPPASNLSSMQRAIVTIQKMRTKLEALERARTEPIAIVGMACRIPGGANTPESFFKLLEDGVDTISEIPADRWRVEQEGANSEGDTRALRWGSFLTNVDRFDAAFFGISPREAESMDPQHRLLLEVTWEALERAGQLPERLMGTKTGVFVGIWAPDYQLRVLTRDPNDLDAYCFTGTVLSTAAGRLSYILGVQGPCMAIDTACSSSLTAIHLACQSLRSGESTMAIAGGVNLMLAPSTTHLLSKTQALSPDGRCKTFDARANGYVRGEGCGMLVLKRLSDAERDGDSILALIRGSAVNQDGRSTGLTAPNVLSQQALLRQALESARLSPQDIAYLETHGTGTSLGDPIEVEAIKAVFGAPRDRGAKCVLGALKSNIGHLEAAAGVAGLIKAVLAMQYEKIPGNLHFRSLNPRIDLGGTPLEIAQTAKPWTPGVRPRYAGISSFGISGTNAHVIIEEPPKNLEEALLEEESATLLLPISAKTQGALRAHAAAYRDMLRTDSAPRLLDIVYTASARRSHYVHRLSVVGRTKHELAEQLDTYLQGLGSTGVAEGKASPARAKIVFVFSGQGSQWLGMGRQLYESDASFRSVIDTCDNLMTSRLGWSILDELDAPETMSRINDTQVAQPLLFAVQVALVEMLRSWGISPDAMIGHSVGEIAAAHIAGILSLDEAIRLVAIRGRIMQKATGMGKMVSVAMTPSEAQAILVGYEDRVAIAAINDPNSVVLSGASQALDDIVLRCERKGHKTRPLRPNYAFHSPQMDVYERELVDRITRVDARRATLAMYSTILGDCVDGKELDVHYWGSSIRRTVDFVGAVTSAIRDGYQLFLEIGPHPGLVRSIQQCLASKNAEGYVIGTLRHGYEERRALLEMAGGLYTRGCSIEWPRVLPSGGRCIPLPTYPWQRERYWVDPSSSAGPIAKKPALAQHPAVSGGANIVFVFPGQGSQWLGMGQDLLSTDPVFRSAIEACDEVIRKEADFSVVAELLADELSSRLDEIDVVQPLLFAVEVALARLWQSKGIHPDCVVGHSMGEIAAAHIAGILTLEDAARIICRRSRLLTRIQGLGAMALVELPMTEAEAAISQYASKLGVAVSNGPRASVISGDPRALADVLARLEAQGVYCKHIKVDIASHSPQVDPVLQDLRANLQDIHGTSGTLSMRSTVTGRPLDGNDVDADYWANNLRQPVRFSEVTRQLANEGFNIFIEMSPHPVLVAAIEENLASLGRTGLAVAAMRRQTPGTQTLQDGVAAVNDHLSRNANLAAPMAQAVHARHGSVDTHPLLAWRFVTASQPDLQTWESWISLESLPYLAKHRVFGEAIFPATGFTEMALAAAQRIFRQTEFKVESISFKRMLGLAEDDTRTVQISVQKESADRATLRISSKSGADDDWVEHADGTLATRASSMATTTDLNRSIVQSRCSQTISSRQHYEQMQAYGLAYGPEFQGVQELHVGAGEVLARVTLPDPIVREAGDYVVHPALLDACFQTAFWAAAPNPLPATYVPTKAVNVYVKGPMPREVWVHTRQTLDTLKSELKVSIAIYDDAGRVLLEVGALHLQPLENENARKFDPLGNCIFEIEWRKSDLVAAQRNDESIGGPWLLVHDDRGFGLALTEQLRAGHGARIVEVFAGHDYAVTGPDKYRFDPSNIDHWNKLLLHAFGKSGCRGVIHCGSLDGAPWSSTSESTLRTDLRRGPWSVLRMAQALYRQGWRDVPKLYVLTRGAQTLENDTHCASVAQATLWGLGRVVAMELPDLGCVRIDLPPEVSSDEPGLILKELIHRSDEDQIALRSHGRHVARLARGSSKSPIEPEKKVPAAGRPYRLEINSPGVLERLAVHVMDRRDPGPGEVEIEVEAAGLNFLDVLLALGVLPDDEDQSSPHGPRLGLECAGRIVRIGPGQCDLYVGQEVIALAPCAMASHVIAPFELVIPKPRELNWIQSATTAIIFATAFYSLRHVAQLHKSERVLIHAGAGGVGMAAIQVAQYIGAEIFATAGSPEKRDLLRKLGVQHVLDSRSLSFVDEIKRITKNEGIDVVLNSLSGEFIPASLGLLRDHGRFIEIGKRDYYENRHLGLRPFLRNLSFSLVDLRSMIKMRPARVGALVAEVMDLFQRKALRPVDCRGLALSNATEAFMTMAQARHTGKLALVVREPDIMISSPTHKSAEIRKDATYLISGGLGGLGLILAQWMVKQGARHIVLVGRTNPKQAAEVAIAEMRNSGATVRVLLGDVARQTDVTSIFDAVSKNMPPLRGIVHAAGLLEDRTILEMNEAEFFRPLEPKVFGLWNLHEATRSMTLDFFVAYSSAAGVLGSPGQANYAAANTFMDALCRARIAGGLPATTIQWGAFADVGLAAVKDVRGKRLAARGSASLKPEDGPALFGRILARPQAEVACMHFDVRQWTEFYPQVAASPFLAELVTEQAKPEQTKTSTSFREVLNNAEPPQRLAILEKQLLEQLGKVLRMDPSRIDRSAPFANLGLDSLMSLELRNRLEPLLDLKLSAALLFTYSTTTALAAHLIEKLFPPAEPEEAAPITLRAPEKPFMNTAPTPPLPIVAPTVVESADRAHEEEPELVDKLEAFEEYLK